MSQYNLLLFAYLVVVIYQQNNGGRCSRVNGVGFYLLTILTKLHVDLLILPCSLKFVLRLIIFLWLTFQLRVNYFYSKSSYQLTLSHLLTPITVRAKMFIFLTS